jgi:hypothetical protein
MTQDEVRNKFVEGSKRTHAHGVDSDDRSVLCEDYVDYLENLVMNNFVSDLVSNTLFVCMDKDDDILSVHRTEKGAISKRKELLKEYLKIGVFKMELLE